MTKRIMLRSGPMHKMSLAIFLVLMRIAQCQLIWGTSSHQILEDLVIHHSKNSTAMRIPVTHLSQIWLIQTFSEKEAQTFRLKILTLERPRRQTSRLKMILQFKAPLHTRRYSKRFPTKIHSNSVRTTAAHYLTHQSKDQTKLSMIVWKAWTPGAIMRPLMIHSHLQAGRLARVPNMLAKWISSSKKAHYFPRLL